MRILIISLVMLLSLPAQAGSFAAMGQVRPPKPRCIYVKSLQVIQWRPRVVAPTFRRVTPPVYAAMKRVTRQSILVPRYDAIYEGTDIATRRIRFAAHAAGRCSAYPSRRVARRALTKRLQVLWRLIKKRPVFRNACCWNPMRLQKAH